MTDVAVRMIAAKAGVGVPVDSAVVAYFVGRVAVLVGVFAILSILMVILLLYMKFSSRS